MDLSTLSYKSLFTKFGLAPQHLTIHRDNYKIHGDISTSEGRANLDLIQSADIIFFNGGDQSRHVRSWLNDDGSPGSLLIEIQKRATRNSIIIAGTSAGSMVWGAQAAGGGDSFGVLYFENSVGIAPKKVTDADMGGSGFDDLRNGTKSLQYYHNAGKMPGFGWLNIAVDTHFNARGRLGRLPPTMIDTKVSLGIGIDESTAFYYNDGTSTVYGYNGVTICDLS